MEQESVKKDWVTDLMESFVIAMALSILIFFTIAAPNEVDGESMVPTFHPQDKLITNKVSQWLGETEVGKANSWDYQRGDIIVFSVNGQDLVKRIIGSGKDKIMIKEGHVYINDKLLKENYIPDTTETNAYTGSYAYIKEGEVIEVPIGSYFVMGDNRGNSKDSRFVDVGLVQRSQIRGMVIVKYWPFNEFTWVKRGDYSELDIN